LLPKPEWMGKIIDPLKPVAEEKVLTSDIVQGMRRKFLYINRELHISTSCGVDWGIKATELN